MPRKKTWKQPSLNIKEATQFRQALIDNGYEGWLLEALFAQAAHETGGFKSALAIENNNFGGK